MVQVIKIVLFYGVPLCTAVLACIVVIRFDQLLMKEAHLQRILAIIESYDR